MVDATWMMLSLLLLNCCRGSLWLHDPKPRRIPKPRSSSTLPNSRRATFRGDTRQGEFSLADAVSMNVVYITLNLSTAVQLCLLCIVDASKFVITRQTESLRLDKGLMRG